MHTYTSFPQSKTPRPCASPFVARPRAVWQQMGFRAFEFAALGIGLREGRATSPQTPKPPTSKLEWPLNPSEKTLLNLALFSPRRENLNCPKGQGLPSKPSPEKAFWASSTVFWQKPSSEVFSKPARRVLEVSSRACQGRNPEPLSSNS